MIAEIVVGMGVAGVLYSVYTRGYAIVRPTHRALIERLGKYYSYKDSGLVLLIPFVDNVTTVNITEQMVNAKQQEVITKDNLNATVDAQVYFKVKDTEQAVKKSAYAVDNYFMQIVALMRTTLRDTIGNLTLREANSKRSELNIRLAKELQTQTDAWGIEVVRCELQEIEPPADVQETMNKVVKAENEKISAVDFATAVEVKADGVKRAKIKEAEGERQSAILEAEGAKKATIMQAEADKTARVLEAVAEKTATILEAEATKQSDVLEAEGEKQATILTANAEAERIKLVNESANKYFIGNAVELRKYNVAENSLKNNSKIIVPVGTDLVNVIGDALGVIPTKRKEKK
jgi:regulator of protease activity HflC (stomatin/prohibitin superfamily)